MNAPVLRLTVATELLVSTRYEMHTRLLTIPRVNKIKLILVRRFVLWSYLVAIASCMAYQPTLANY